MRLVDVSGRSWVASPRWVGALMAAIATTGLSLAGCDSAGNEIGDAGSEASTADSGPPYLNCPNYNADKNLYWGDIHNHTVLSADAYAWGNRNFPIDAYLFATEPNQQTPIAAGAEPPGPTVSIDRALDFVAVTDHSEWLGATWGCGELPDGHRINPLSPFVDSPACADYRAQTGKGTILPTLVAADMAVAHECEGGLERSPGCIEFTSSAWQVEIQAAHEAYQRCSFTTFVAYEWTRAAHGATLHQNVIFGSEHVPYAPFDSNEYKEPSELWTALAASCRQAEGCSALTIPHNGNLSQGMAYELPVGVDATRQMNDYQRLTEIHQTKGNSECYAGPGATDPKCDFEHVAGPEYPAGFVRNALVAGITAYAAQMDGGGAVDPLQMGIVASTDDHNGTPGSVKEDEWKGHIGDLDDTPEKRLLGTPTYNPGGITGVWAEENTREALFAALRRRETYGTSGPRITVRFYQVWDQGDYCGAAGMGGGFPHNVIAAGGVPMGGTMSPPPANDAVPKFIVSALKDLSDIVEVDIVKAMVVGGKVTEHIHRITPTTPHTVWSNGSVCAGFLDLDFDTQGPAVYYARVLQTPTWRWSHFDCAAAPSIHGCQPGGPLDVMIQERAWTSPIWWLP
jgi:hypothetical protein